MPGDARPKHVDLEPGAAWPCAWKCRKRTYAHHHCAGENYCENHDPGAPEITACRGGACARFDGRVHVHDAAARGWILPHIIALAEDRAKVEPPSPGARALRAAEERARGAEDRAAAAERQLAACRAELQAEVRRFSTGRISAVSTPIDAINC